MVKVLEVSSSLDVGGAETLLINILDNINKSKFKIDFLCFGKKKYAYEERILKNNSNIYRVNKPSDVGIFKHIFDIYSFLKKNRYDVVHCHNLFNCGPVLFASWLAGVRIRIAHSHTTEYLSDNKITFKKKLYYIIARFLIKIFANKKIACSKKAGKFLYGKSNFMVLTNGIDTQKFIYSKKMREEIRLKYAIKDEDIVIGHVGRFIEVKNQIFLIELLEDLLKENTNYKLLLIGDGELKNHLYQVVKEKNISENVIFTGIIDDVYNYYSAMDLFVFPSIVEGLPLTLIEVQTNGLPLIASSNISNESNITNSILFLDLSNKETWIKEIKKNSLKKRNYNINSIVKNGFDIKKTVEIIQEIYSL